MFVNLGSKRLRINIERDPQQYRVFPWWGSMWGLERCNLVMPGFVLREKLVRFSEVNFGSKCPIHHISPPPYDFNCFGHLSLRWLSTQQQAEPVFRIRAHISWAEMAPSPGSVPSQGRSLTRERLLINILKFSRDRVENEESIEKRSCPEVFGTSLYFICSRNHCFINT